MVCLPGIAQPIPGRYIVELTDSPAGALLGGRVRSAPAAFVARLAAIRANQAKISMVVRNHGGRILDSADTALNAMFVAIDDSSAAGLRRLPGVLRVTQQRRYHARLDRAAALSRVPEAWARSGGDGKAGLGIRIAILDSGIDFRHPGFRDDALLPPSIEGKTPISNKVIVARSYESLFGPGYSAGSKDVYNHGTSVACAAACVVHKTELGTISGVAPKAFLGSYKVLDDQGDGSDAAIIKAIDDSIKDGFDVLNLSLGTDVPVSPDADPIVQALEVAASAGLIIAVAAGNAGPDDNSINSPGTAESVITVGSSSSDRRLTVDGAAPLDPNQISGFSSRGPNPGRTLKPDMVAVGDNVFSASSSDASPAALYEVTQGTSLATPIVAGAAAVLKAARPGYSAAQYRSLLINTASDIRLASGGSASIRQQGAGRLDLASALEMPVAFSPPSINFGAGGDAPDLVRQVTAFNLLDEPVTVEFSIRAYDGRPAAELRSPAKLDLAANGSALVDIALSGTALTGEFQGLLLARTSRNAVEARVPYWYAVRANKPSSIPLLGFTTDWEAGQPLTFGARVVDAAGLDIAGATPTVTAATTGTRVNPVVPPRAESPGVFGIQTVLAPGLNTLILSAGDVVRTVNLIGY